VLIAGGYGLVGGWVARHLRAAGHDLDLVLGGRRPEAGAALAANLGARTVQLEVDHPELGLAQAGPVDLVIAALQDPGDNLLAAALKAGAAHIGITRTTDTMGSTVIAAAALAKAPVLMLGHWQAGVLTLAARAVALEFAKVEAMRLAALYDYGDPIGPMTASDAGGFVGRALVREAGTWASLDAAVSGRRVSRGEGRESFDALPMGVMDTPALAATTGARDVRFDLGTGQSLGAAAGGPASHDMYLEISGVLADGTHAERRVLISDPKGQAHLTALGVLLGAERLLGLDGAAPPPPGLRFPESTLDPRRAMARLAGFGVRMETLS
jgi:hypothetical protein